MMNPVDEIYQEVLYGLTGIKSSCIYNNQSFLKEILNLSEFSLVERITSIGEKYCEIKNYLDIAAQDKDSGFYLVKLVERVEKCLEVYVNVVVELQSQPACLSLLYSRIHPFSELITGLLMLTRELKTNLTRGTALLETLDKHFNASTRNVQVAIQFIYQGVNQLLLNHLQSWLIYGEVTDIKQEFFIQKNPSPNSNSPFHLYSLHCLLVPSFIRPTIADRILNIGQTVLFLRSRPEKKYDPSMAQISINQSGVTPEKAKDLILLFKEAANAHPKSQWVLMEKITESVANLATTQLHYLAMVDGGLVQQVHNIKDVFLMGRGELFHEFVTQTDIKLSKASTANSFLDLNLLLDSCARKVIIKEEMLAPFSLEMTGTLEGPQLSIQYSVPWPLELIFTKQVINSYNNVFRFLLRLKRIQVRMVAAWLRDKKKRRLMACVKRRQLQHNLWFLVNNLQYYLQVDVLESQYVSLEAAVVASDNFEDIRTAHASFLANLLVQSFLDCLEDGNSVVNPVQQRIHNILLLCEEFCTQTQRYADYEMPGDVVDCLTVKFDACFESLFILLGALKKHASHPGCQHLGQLLLRLDFNRYFSSNSVFKY